MPRGIYSNFECPKDHPKFTPQEHQKFVRNYFINTPFKGLLLFHRLGSGKTCSSIIIADALLKLRNIDKVYVFSPGSLRQGWINEYCGVCGDELLKKYTFVTYNYGVANSLPENFDNSLIIIDEVHNLINSVKNQSKTAVVIYNKLVDSDCKILALSGTPVFNNIYEWPILGNLLKPGSFKPVIVNGNLQKDQFMDLFNIDAEGYLTVKDKAAFDNAVRGIISYFPGLGGDAYPELVVEPIVKSVMTADQAAIAFNKANNEQFIINKGPPPPSLKLRDPAKYEFDRIMYIMAIKRILSRRPSNFLYPKFIRDLEENEQSAPEDALVSKGGWIEKDLFSDGQLRKEYSKKVYDLLQNILNNFNSKHMVFTFFKTRSGVNLIKAILDMCGGIRSAVFSGDLSDKQRQSLLKKFNSPENRDGDIIKVIFVTDAGAEGITLLETEHVHILESDVRENKIQQAIGRVVRYKSHVNMPKNRQKVHLWRYWSVYPDKSNGKSIDEKLYKEGQIKLNTYNSFFDLLIENSIES